MTQKCFTLALSNLKIVNVITEKVDKKVRLQKAARYKYNFSYLNIKPIKLYQVKLKHFKI